MSQRGSALLFVLLAIVVLGTITAALAAFASANQRSTRAFENVRTDRYAADAAVKEAVNWISQNQTVAVDPAYEPNSNADCVYHSPSSQGRIVTVSCSTEQGSGSGVPPDEGINPPEGLLLLGDRHNEPGPYSSTRCYSVLDDIKAFFNGTQRGGPEFAFTGQKRLQASGWGVLGCQARARGNDPIRVEGDVVVGGKLKLSDGLKLLVEGGSGGDVQVRYGCDLSGGAQIVAKGSGWTAGNKPVTDVSSQAQCNRSASTLRDQDPNDPMPWDGSTIFSDPGRKSSVTGAYSPSPIGDLQDQFLPVGFAADGSLKPGYTLPERLTAYRYDPAAWAALNPKPANVPEGLVEMTSPVNGAGACTVPSGTPVVFLWGWYRSSEVVNRYTAEKGCPDQTYWFAPNPGPDGKLLTVDDTTAAFYMDFTTNDATARTKSACGGMQAQHYARWCLGGADQTLASKPRVVVGWPNNWPALPVVAPQGSGSNTNTGYGSRVGVQLNRADSIEGDFLSYWTSPESAKSIDQNVAKYQPCSFTVLVWIIRCPSLGSRSLRMAQFTPKVAGGPIAETSPSLPRGLIKVDVAMATRNSSGLTPKIVVDRLDQSNGTVQTCGTFALQLSNVVQNYNPNSAFPASSVATISPTDQATLATSCGAVDQINNLRITFQVDGNWSNSGGPEFFLDGARIYYDSYQGASFPIPADGNIANVGTNGIPKEPAKSDCDETKPGGQLIFGGESHVYVADGSLEVCGGTNPSDPAGSLVIGVYGIPAVDPIRPSSASWAGGNSLDTSESLAGATRIGDPDGGATNNQTKQTTIRYNQACSPSIGCSEVQEGRVDLTYSPVNVPSKYDVTAVKVRTSYNPKNASGCAVNSWINSSTVSAIVNFFLSCTPPELRKVGSANWPITMPTSNSLLSINDVMKSGNTAVDELTQAMPTPSRISQADLEGGLTLQWAARGNVVCGAFICPSKFEDTLDGVELDAVLTPKSAYANQPMLRPQSGCTVARPNYDRGEGTPDCALIRVDSFSPTDSEDKGLCLGTCSTRRTNWFGRLSVKGTIYSPSSAVEIDDNDLGYPLASRGAILRSLRISGSKERANFVEPAIGGEIDRTPADRTTVLTACVQEGVDPNTPRPCSRNAGDRILARSGLTFSADPAVVNARIANVPHVDWYTDERT